MCVCHLTKPRQVKRRVSKCEYASGCNSLCMFVLLHIYMGAATDHILVPLIESEVYGEFVCACLTWCICASMFCRQLTQAAAVSTVRGLVRAADQHQAFAWR